METILRLKTYVDGVNDTPFPSSDNQIEIGSFDYNAKRMGGAPTISATVMWESCLDDVWTKKVYAEFNGEKYFLKQTPSSSYDNTDLRYEHSLELVSERIALDNVYFYDAVSGTPQEGDKPVSNSANVLFFGTIEEFVSRMNASLEYAGLLAWEDDVDEDGNAIKVANGYNVVIDEGITSEGKQMSFNNQFFSNVLQEIFNTYELPYYFVGKTIHVGYTSNVISETFRYGVDDALLSISKNVANNKVVNRVTGLGSEENIPYYYPNESPLGEISFSVGGQLEPSDIDLYDKEAISYSGLKSNTVYTFWGDSDKNSLSKSVIIPSNETQKLFENNVANLRRLTIENDSVGIVVEYDMHFDSKGDINVSLDWQLNNTCNPYISIRNRSSASGKNQIEVKTQKVALVRDGVEEELEYSVNTEEIQYYDTIIPLEDQADIGEPQPYLRETGIRLESTGLELIGDAKVRVYLDFKKLGNFWECVPDYYSVDNPYSDIAFLDNSNINSSGGWRDESGKSYDMLDCGIRFLKEPVRGDFFSYFSSKFVKTSKNLMPIVYRHSDANERFYNAIDYPYLKNDDYVFEPSYIGEDGKERNAVGEYIVLNEEDGLEYIHNDNYKKENGEYIDFGSPYTDESPVEQIIEFPDIKPTIKGMLNSDGEPIDEFLEFAFDLNDNNEINADGDYIHSHFFAKLRKLPFNIFDHAIENGEMTVNMTGGSLGGCTFVIAVSEEDSDGKQWNTVQVNSDGSLKRDPQTGDVICGVEGQGDVIPQESQNDTRYNEVWIALKKDINYTTYARPTLDASAEDSVVTFDTGGTAIEGKEGHYLPYENTTFVITNIHLPKECILNAEERLKTALIEYLAENNQEKFNFSIAFSRIYLAEKDEEFLRLLNENARIYVEYNNNVYLLYVSSYSYKMSSGELLPEISVELSEDLTSSQNSLQQAISEVKGDLLDTIGQMDVLGQGTYYFLRKDQKDRARKTITFEEGLEVGDYNEGTLGSGAKIGVDTNGNTHIEADYLKIRKKATFTQISVQELKSVGGEIVISPAAMVCSSVEETTTTYNDTEVEVYRCYLNTNDNDGNHIYNEFAIDDLARCQTFNVLGTKYYWRTVVGVGDNYIDLSKDECDTNSDIPEAGDNIALLGNKSDTERQSAILLSAYGENAPSFIMYNGINWFNLADKNVTGITWNPLTQEPQLYSYGDFFFGSRETDDNGNPTGDFITYQRRAGENKRSLNINATVNFSSDSTGLSNLSDWKALEEDMEKKVDTSVLEDFSSQVTTSIENLQDQIDGAITSWFYSGVPTLDNAPADEWTTDNMKNNHLGDLYYDEESGKAYRFQLNSSTNVYEWRLISDEDITKALTMAQGAQDTADGKRRVFYETPTPPYDKGDLWSQGSEGDLKICAVAKEKGASYADSDWVKATKYTDDTLAQEAKELADATQSAINDKQYLFDLLADGSTIIEGGAIMTNLVAVRDSDDNKIVAFLNGSGEFSDTTHRKLILASGIPSTTESGSTAIESRASEASTRIYDDGHLVSKSGKLETMEINSLRSMVSQIDNIGYLSNVDDDASPWYIKEFKKYNGKANSPDDIIFGNNRTSPVKDPTSSWIESWETEPDLTWHISQIGRKRVFINHKNSTGYSVSHLTLEAPSSAFSFFEDGQKKSEITVEANECIELYGYGYHTREDRSQGVFMGWIVTNRVRLYSDCAKKISGNVEISSGVVAGLRPKFRRVTTSPVYLTKYDHTIECQGSNTINLYLPTSPEVGQCYEIWKWKEQYIYIRTQDNYLITRIAIVASTAQGIDTTFFGIIKLVYGGGEMWTMTLHRSE